MASPLLFDIEGIDTSAVALSAEQVGRINPQAGDMRHLDHVIWVDQDTRRIIGVKQVREDEFWVPGHIPGRPLLPGVLMIEAAAQLCSVLNYLKSREERFVGFTRCRDAAFRGQVVPGNRLLLLAEELSYRPRRFVSRAQGLVDGRLCFEAEITGMVI